jgi:methyl-accepting chemotaxis protein
MSNLNPQTTELLLATAVAFAMVVQAIVVLAAFFMIRKTIRTLHEEISETRVKAMGLLDKAHPIIDDARDLVAKTKPKIESAVSDLVEVTHKLRAESNDVQKATHEIVERVRHQAMRTDSMMTKTLDAVDRAAGFVTDAMGKPMRQFSAILASAKAVVESLRNGAADGQGRSHAEHASKGPDYYA